MQPEQPLCSDTSAEKIREKILGLRPEQPHRFTERSLRVIARMPSAVKQIRALERLKAGLAE